MTLSTPRTDNRPPPAPTVKTTDQRKTDHRPPIKQETDHRPKSAKVRQQSQYILKNNFVLNTAEGHWI